MIPLALPSRKKVRKAIKRFRRKAEAPCPRGMALLALLEDGDPSVPMLRPTEEEKARLRLINDAKAYCIARCGGCALTEGWSPPA